MIKHYCKACKRTTNHRLIDWSNSTIKCEWCEKKEEIELSEEELEKQQAHSESQYDM